MHKCFAMAPLRGASVQLRGPERQCRASVLIKKFNERKCNSFFRLGRYSGRSFALETSNSGSGSLRRFNSRVRRRPKAPRAGDDEIWQNAKRIARELDKVLDAQGPQSGGRPRLCRTRGVDPAHLRSACEIPARARVSALLSHNGIRRSKRLAENVEAIIAATLRGKWMIWRRHHWLPVVGEIRYCVVFNRENAVVWARYCT